MFIKLAFVTLVNTMVQLLDYKCNIFPKLTPVQERCRGERIPVVSAIVHSVTLMMKKRVEERISISI